MPAALVKYEERPRSKLLPLRMVNPSIARGTLSPSRPESVAFYWVKWAALNISLFLLPLAMGLTALPFLGAPPRPLQPQLTQGSRIIISSHIWLCIPVHCWFLVFPWPFLFFFGIM
ncbi:hypothetical protein FB451DRAFT_1189094 [Mycena latifolia]|nr:hypothetical protein FB451DRAFT_1189094 [Mycena latifolia]